MITFNNVDKSFGGQIIMNDVSLQFNRGEKTGIVGRNGQGKSTLLKMIVGLEESDSGSIDLPSNIRLGYLRQHIDLNHKTVREEVVSAIPGFMPGEEYKAEAILMGLGFTMEDLDKEPLSFSGGMQLRIELAKVLVAEADILLLDEPTNYLDIVTLQWLKTFLQKWRGEIILITHNKNFMEAVVTHTVIIRQGVVKKAPGGPSKLYELIKTEEEILEKTRQNQDKKRKQTEEFIAKFRSKARGASQAQSRIKMLEKQEEIKVLPPEKEVALNFRASPFKAKFMVEVKDLSFAYQLDHELISELTFALKKGEKFGVVGKNGSGKSTLIKLLAGKIKGTKGEFKFHKDCLIGHYDQTHHSTLVAENSLEQEIQRVNADLTTTEVRGLLGQMLFSGDTVEKKVKMLSGGERSRVLFAQILARDHNLLLLDEPGHHLDMESISSLKKALKKFSGSVMLVSHDEDLLAHVAQKLIVFGCGKPFIFEGSYGDYVAKYGISDGDDISSKQQNKSSSKQNKQKRAEIVRQRSRETSGLKREVEQLEREIEKLEKEKDRCSVTMIGLSADDSAGEKMSELSKKFSTMVKTLDGLYEQLDIKLSLYEEMDQKFQEQLDAL